MGELNTELVSAIQRSSTQLESELKRLRGGAVRFEEQGDLLKQAIEAIEGAGAALTSTSDQLRVVGDEVARLDPAAVARAIDEANQGVTAVAGSLRSVQTAIDQNARATVDVLSEVSKRLEVVAERVEVAVGKLSKLGIDVGQEMQAAEGRLTAQVQDLYTALGQELQTMDLRVDGQMTNLSSQLDAQRVANQKAINDLDEALSERTRPLSAVTGMLIVVIVLVLVAIGIGVFKP